MFEFLKSKEEKQLDGIILRMEMNLSNNYKDNAQDNLKEFEEVFTRMQADGVLKQKTVAKYEEVLYDYRKKLEGYSHKDQKPFWT